MKQMKFSFEFSGIIKNDDPSVDHIPTPEECFAIGDAIAAELADHFSVITDVVVLVHNPQ